MSKTRVHFFFLSLSSLICLDYKPAKGFVIVFIRCLTFKAGVCCTMNCRSTVFKPHLSDQSVSLFASLVLCLPSNYLCERI